MQFYYFWGADVWVVVGGQRASKESGITLMGVMWSKGLATSNLLYSSDTEIADKLSCCDTTVNSGSQVAGRTDGDLISHTRIETYSALGPGTWDPDKFWWNHSPLSTRKLKTKFNYWFKVAQSDLRYLLSDGRDSGSKHQVISAVLIWWFLGRNKEVTMRVHTWADQRPEMPKFAPRNSGAIVDPG